VYKARHRSSGTLVALKISYAPKGDRVLIRREAQILGKLDHPHIVRILESGEAGDRTFFSMDWLSGGDLADRLCDGPLPPPEAMLLVAKLSDAFHVAHLRRIVYTDTRPTNVVFSDRGEPTLVDFGLA
jgi:serine/threonine protein kinase